MPDEPDTTDARLKIVETTLASLVRDVGGKLHGIFEKADQALAGVVAMKEQREKGVDITARVLALIAIAAATAIGCAMYFKHGDIKQDVKQETHVDRPLTQDELADQYVRDVTGVPLTTDEESD